MFNGPFLSRLIVATLTILGSAGLLYFQRIFAKLTDQELGGGLLIVMGLSTLVGYLTSFLSEDVAGRQAPNDNSQARLDEMRTNLVRTSTQLITLANFAKLNGTNEPLARTLQGAIRMISREFFAPKLCVYILEPGSAQPKLSEHSGYTSDEVDVLQNAVEESLIDWVVRKQLVYSEFDAAPVQRPGSGTRKVASTIERQLVGLVGEAPTQADLDASASGSGPITRSGDSQMTMNLEREHPELQATRRVNKIPTVYCMPLSVGAEIVGVLNISTIDQGKEVAFQEASRFLSILGSLLALRIQSGLLVERIQALSVKDQISGLFTWEYAEQVLEVETNRAQRYEFPLGLLLLELQDHEDLMRESGEDAVNRVMVGLAEIIAGSRRGVDVPFRFSTSHCGLILPHTGLEGLISVAQRLNQDVNRKVFTGTRGEILLVSFAIGLAAFPDHADSAGSMVQMALQGLETARSAGKNRITLVRTGEHETLLF